MIIKLKLKKQVDKSYDIQIEHGLFYSIVKDIKQFGNKFLIITDSNLKELASNLLVLMKKARLETHLITFKAGEQNKNIKSLSELLEETFEIGLDRKSCIIAFGGGVVGDMAGLVAATYMRGINYVQVPTTLMAMVDSSVGGKVAIDLSQGKNSCGAFYQPKKVYIDPEFLKTLPYRQFLNGLAEVIKYALVYDKSFFDYIEKNIENIKSLDPSVVEMLIQKGCEIKAKVVAKDEKEEELRKILNFGHTIGHALEIISNYKLAHGEAVATGMVVEARIANEMSYLKRSELLRIIELMKQFGYETRAGIKAVERIVKIIRKDKKSVNKKAQFILLQNIGKVKSVSNKVSIHASDSVVLKALQRG